MATTGVSPLAMWTNSLTEYVTEHILIGRVARTREVKGQADGRSGHNPGLMFPAWKPYKCVSRLQSDLQWVQYLCERRERWWGVVVVGGDGGGVNYARTSVQSPTASSVTGYSHHVFLPTTCTEILLVHIRSMCLLAPQGGCPQCSHSLPGRGGGQTLVSRSQTLTHKLAPQD